MQSRLPLILLAVLLIAMAAFMYGPMRNETATVDETTFMGGGYAYFKTGECHMAEENPLLAQMIIAAPMLAFDVHISDQARALMEQKGFFPFALRWDASVAGFNQLFPRGPNWYHYGLAEPQYFGKILVYDPANDAERLLFWSRFTQMLLTLATAAFLFFWAREWTGNDWAGLFAASLWAFNPIALGYGHLAITEPGITLLYGIAIWWFTRTVAAPHSRNVSALGAITAVAIQMKFLALILLPTYVALLALLWLRDRKIAAPKTLAMWVGLFVAGFWVTALIIYFPHWSPPPTLDPAQAVELRVPGWFLVLRPLLIPAEFAKAVALKLVHSQVGTDAFLMGEWSKTGWWYYYPVAMWFKTPLPLIVLTLFGAGLLLARLRTAEYKAVVPWAAAMVYLLSALTSKIDIGVRHVMPLYPLLAVGIAIEIFRLRRQTRLAASAGIAWLAGVALFAAPDFLAYCNEFAGGTKNGYRVMLDSSYDWGQDGKRLKQWMAENNVAHIYLDFFGTQTAIEWHKIPNTRVSGEQANQIKNGVLVVSASQLMRPEWTWLREQRQPAARIGYTLFVYRFP